MTEDESLDGAAESNDDRGYCVMEWDGETWHVVPGGIYCNEPNVPPDPADVAPNGEPGTWEMIGCVPYYNSGLQFAARSAPQRSEMLAGGAEVASAPAGHPSAPPAEYTAIARLNLIYHTYPNAANDVWLRNVRQLRRRLPIFNGRRIVAIATGPGLVHPDEVQAAIAWPDVESLLVPNDAEIGEVASFSKLLAAVRSKDPGEATFYAHTKGASNTRDDATAIEYWRNAMYAALLDDPVRVKESLQRYAAVGACKSVHPHMLAFPSQIRWGHWHFAGTFFWFRHDRIFSDFRWPFIPYDRWGVEAWLGGFLAPHEAGSLLQPRAENDYTWNGYERHVWTDLLADPAPAQVAGHGSELRISVVIPCKGRLSHLRRTLPHWFQQQVPAHEIIVVDDDCPDRCGDWIDRHHPGVRVVRAVSGAEFNICRSRNLGAAEASGDYLSFADADFIAPPDYLERVAGQIRAGHDLVCIAHYDSGELGLNGTCSMSAELYHRVRGYDESHPTYGFDDTDFYHRCQAAGGSMGYLHNCQCIRHSDSERMRFYPEQDKAEALQKSAAWLADRSRSTRVPAADRR